MEMDTVHLLQAQCIHENSEGSKRGLRLFQLRRSFQASFDSPSNIALHFARTLETTVWLQNTQAWLHEAHEVACEFEGFGS